ncbi:hypothetical protein GCM10025792_24280 [Pseudonocardia tropica]
MAVVGRGGVRCAQATTGGSHVQEERSMDAPHAFDRLTPAAYTVGRGVGR